MAKKDVLIIVGSESDRDRVTGAFEVLDQAGVGYDFVVSSTHRNPEQTAQIAKDARSKGYRVVIAAAGLAAALPGFIASLTDLPVIGVPLDVGPLRGVDALYAMAQLPSGCPVGTVGIGNAKNAALLALRILKC
ncbi:MAG: AIR carboxylase family protein [Gemmatimonadetes bacterium]|nr:AIR carboxylase family protein [Gemmatimonadota bacterium]